MADHFSESDDDIDMNEGGNPETIPNHQPDEVDKEINITSDGGVKKIIKKLGEGLDKPSTHSNVKDGTVFDSSRKRDEPFSFKLGEGSVIKGWDKGVASMKRGELSELICSPDYAYGANGSPPAIPPNATLTFEVELISWTTSINVTSDGALTKVKIVSGSGYETPNDGSTATINLIAKCNEKVLLEWKEQSVIVGSDPNINEAIEKAIKSMNLSEKSTFTLHKEYMSKFGYQEKEDIIFDIELIKVDNNKGRYSMSMDEKINLASRLKGYGNGYFGAKQYDRACTRYDDVISMFKYTNEKDSTAEQMKTIKELQLLCNINMAACKLKERNYSEVIKLCDSALEIDKNNIKALFRKGDALLEMKEPEEALKLLNEAYSKSGDKSLLKLLDRAKSELKTLRDKEKKLYRVTMVTKEEEEARKKEIEDKKPKPMKEDKMDVEKSTDEKMDIEKPDDKKEKPADDKEKNESKIDNLEFSTWKRK